MPVCFLSDCQSTSLSICLPVVYSIFLLFCLSVCCSICMLVCPIYRSDRLFVDQLSVNLSKISNFGTVSPILRIQRAIYVRYKFPVDLDAEKSRNRARNHVFFSDFWCFIEFSILDTRINGLLQLSYEARVLIC